MLRPRWIVGFAGHRKSFTREPVLRALGTVLDELAERAARQHGTVEVASGVAAGCDLLLAQTARERRLAHHVVLPLTETELENDFADRREEWPAARAAIERAKDGADGGTFRIAEGARDRPDCYFDAGVTLLQGSDVLVVVWDGEQARGTGGTAEVLAQARAEEQPTVVIDAASGAIDRSDLPSDWPRPDPILDDVNAWIGGSADSDFDDLFRRVDDIATREGKSFRPGVVLAILLHGTAALLAAATATRMAVLAAAGGAGDHTAELASMTAVELLMVVGALLIVRYQRKAGTHHRWLRGRLAAEILRGLGSTRGLLDPLDAHVTHHAPEWRRFSVSAALLARSSPGARADWETLRDRYVEQRIDDQAKHFRERLGPARFLRMLTEKVVVVCAYSAPVFVLLSLVNKLAHLGLEEDLGAVAVTWMPIALPLVAGMATGLRTALDTGRRTSRYKSMEARLEEFGRRIVALRTESSVRAAVQDCEDLLVDENLEWYLATSEVEAL